MKKSNKLYSMGSFFGGEDILARLAESNYFLFKEIKRYIKFAKESKKGKQVFMKLIRGFAAKI